MLTRRQQSISGLFLDINLLIYYAKEKIIYYDKERPENLVGVGTKYLNQGVSKWITVHYKIETCTRHKN